MFSALLLKGTVGEDADNTFERALLATGAVRDCWSCPVLQARCVNSSVLKDELQMGVYSALAVTSKRAAWALREAAQDAAAYTVLKTTPVFCVGSGTEEACASAGAPNVVGVPGGRGAADLAEFMVPALGGEIFDRPVLFLVGDKRLDELPRRLQGMNVKIKELLVYETATRADIQVVLTAELARLRAAAVTDPGAPQWVVLFSPSGVVAASSAIHLELYNNVRFRLAAIGQTTANAMRAAGLRVDAIAATPTPGALADALFKSTTAISLIDYF